MKLTKASFLLSRSMTNDKENRYSAVGAMTEVWSTNSYVWSSALEAQRRVPFAPPCLKMLTGKGAIDVGT